MIELLEIYENLITGENIIKADGKEIEIHELKDCEIKKIKILTDF